MPIISTKPVYPPDRLREDKAGHAVRGSALRRVVPQPARPPRAFDPVASAAVAAELERDLWRSLRPYSWARPPAGVVTREHRLASLLTTARELDDGDRYLDPTELRRARELLNQIVPANAVAELHRRIDLLGRQPEVRVERILEGAQPIDAIHLPCRGSRPRLRILITGGVHGNEPCGAGAAMLLAERLAEERGLRQQVEITVVPLVNPSGMAAGTRRDADDVDHNRVFNALDQAPAGVRAMAGLIDRGYDLVIDLHSANPLRNGFFALQADARELMQAALRRFSARWPLLHGEISSYQLLVPGLAESNNEGTLKGYAHGHGARWAVTVEAPGSLDYAEQVVGEYALALDIIAVALEQKKKEDSGTDRA